MAKNNGTIVVAGIHETSELRCPYGCDGGDVTVDPVTGECSVCHEVFNISRKDIVVENVQVIS